MRVLMFGWEFPPFISGGLGTACHGLTKALSRSNVAVTFVLPTTIDPKHPSHVRLLGMSSPHSVKGEDKTLLSDADLTNVTFRRVPSRIASPYQSASGQLREGWVGAPDILDELDLSPSDRSDDPPSGGGRYEGDLIGEAQRYAAKCVDLARHENFDVVHAHDWLTFPAGLAVAAAYGKPLVVHVHSTEFDRAGEDIHQQVYDVERRGMHAAMRVVAVSHLTAAIIEHRYAVDPTRIEVIYNGIDNGDPDNGQRPRTAIRRGDKVVLFLGRITMQKGPEYFVMAAKKVLEKIANVKFVMAGTGDKIQDIIELAAREGIGHRVLFTGFLRGEDVNRVYRMADVYVMPSVSEPFGIAPLEAIRHDVPVIISKTSGVAEVLSHALKVDFWDTDEIANKIIAVLKHPPLSSTLREHADIEVRRLTWDDAAQKCSSVYEALIGIAPAMASS